MENGNTDKEKFEKEIDLMEWDDIPSQPIEQKPQLKWEVNESHEVEFICDKPIRQMGEDGAYYRFNVLHKGEEKVFFSSAWTLLTGLKINIGSNLQGKKAVISKRQEGKKKFYVVDKPKEEVVQ